MQTALHNLHGRRLPESTSSEHMWSVESTKFTENVVAPLVAPLVRPSEKKKKNKIWKESLKIVKTHKISAKNQYSNSCYHPDSILKVDF